MNFPSVLVSLFKYFYITVYCPKPGKEFCLEPGFRCVEMESHEISMRLMSNNAMEEDGLQVKVDGKNEL